jgi:Arsenical resistance operon protein ArsD
MTTVTVYDPAMCCSTGICGAEVDQTLVNFAADLDWLQSQGVKVTRINLSQEPAKFAANGTVSAVLQDTGVDGLPVILIGDQMHSSGRYPARAELADMAGIADAEGATGAQAQTQSGCCCGGESETGKTSSGCC